ncbi:MAG: hypothetical protein IJG97_02485 [Bacilli bacterium]|nr:hypothetical protein [Bacilli bacterium]
MKTRNYERKDLIIFLIILLLGFELISIIVLLTIKTNKYFKISGIVIKDNLIFVIVNKDERKIIYSDKVLYFNNKRYKYNIVEDRGIVMKKNNENYYQLVLEFKLKNMKANDVVEIVFTKERMRLIEIFKIIWEGG